MLDLRCECGKVVCQSDHEYVIIKCRHCKRFMVINLDDYDCKEAITPHFLNNIQSIIHQLHKHH